MSLKQGNTNGTHASETSLSSIAEEVVSKVKKIERCLEQEGFASPGFAANSFAHPETIEYARLCGELKESVENLQYLVGGPKKHIRSLCCQGYELAAIQVALEFNLFSLVPAKGSIELDVLAKQSGLGLDRTHRIVRLLATEFIFREPRPGHIAHSPSSYLLYEDEEVRATMHYTLDEMLKAASATADNAIQSPLAYHSAVTPFATRHGLPIFEFYQRDARCSVRFAKAMAGWAKLNLNINALRDAFPWRDLEGTVVDIGGGSGKVSITLAQAFPKLNFIVQDSADMHTAGQALLTDDVRGRVSFMLHSFFEPQPVHNAAAYILRACALNWYDADVVRMFRAVVTGLEQSPPGTPLLVNDLVAPLYGEVSREFEQGLRQIDMIMLVGFGGKLRTPVEFEALLKKADTRYQVRSFRPEGLMGLLEVYLER